MKIVRGLLVFIYVVFALIVIMCYLCHNKYGYSEIGDYGIVSIKEKLSNYKKGDLLLVKKETPKEKSEVIYYDGNKKSVNIAKIVEIKNTNKNEKTLVDKNGKYISSEYYIGKVQNKCSFLGYVYDFTLNKYGFLGLIILPIALMLLFLIKKLKEVGFNEKN